MYDALAKFNEIDAFPMVTELSDEELLFEFLFDDVNSFTVSDCSVEIFCANLSFLDTDAVVWLLAIDFVEAC